MNPEQLKQRIVDALEALKGRHILALDVREFTGMTDYMVIATGGSVRQAKALAKYLLEDAKKAGCPLMGVEGLDQPDWVLVDLVDVVVHVMVPEARELYRLEELWSDPAKLAR